MEKSKIEVIFISSVWIFIGLLGYQILLNILHSKEIANFYPAGYDFKIFLAPTLLLVGELFLWFTMFRYQKYPAKIFAGFIGTYILLMIVLVNMLTGNLAENGINTLRLWMYLYTGFGHLIYALFGRESDY